MTSKKFRYLAARKSRHAEYIVCSRITTRYGAFMCRITVRNYRNSSGKNRYNSQPPSKRTTKISTNGGKRPAKPNSLRLH